MWCLLNLCRVTTKKHVNTNFLSGQMQPVCDGNALRRLVLPAVAGRASHTTKTTWQPIDDYCFQCKGMLWILKISPAYKEPEDGICSVSRLLLPDFWDTNPPRLLQKKWVPLLGSWGPWEAAYPMCAGPASRGHHGGCSRHFLQQTQWKDEHSLSSCTFYWVVI